MALATLHWFQLHVHQKKTFAQCKIFLEGTLRDWFWSESKDGKGSWEASFKKWGGSPRNKSRQRKRLQEAQALTGGWEWLCGGRT